jgi:hypothetical protein
MWDGVYFTLYFRESKGAKIMNKKFSVGFFRMIVIVAIMSLCMLETGCRRTDVRDFEVSIPALKVENEAVVRQALARFGGVDKASMKFDHKAKKLVLKYDSMQLAKKNIELAIAKAGLEANGVTPASVGVR